MIDTCPHCGEPLSVESLDRNDGAKARSTDPDTSHESAKIVFPRRPSQRRRILLSFFNVPYDQGQTAWEIHEAVGLPLNSVSTRMSELERGGWVVVKGDRRNSDQGNPNQIYRLSMAAMNEFANE